MGRHSFLSLNGEQSCSMPRNLRDWIPEGDLVCFLLDLVSEMDLGPFFAKYRADGWGAPADQPARLQVSRGLSTQGDLFRERSMAASWH